MQKYKFHDFPKHSLLIDQGNVLIFHGLKM